MTEPRFSVGQLVAVCTRSMIVIPETFVVAVDQIHDGDVVTLTTLKQRRFVGPSVYVYQLADSDGWFGEQCLRPIDKSEYQESNVHSKELTKCNG